MKVILLCLLFSSVALGNIQVKGLKAKNIWKSIKLISIIEEIQIIKTKNDSQMFLIDNVQCVFEMYNACSFFTDINSKRKMIVAMDGTAQLMKSMADVGIYVDTIHARVATKSIECFKNRNLFSCQLIRFE